MIRFEFMEFASYWFLFIYQTKKPTDFFLVCMELDSKFFIGRQ